ncbi:LuxR C-terminal-related transcriptional regulator [Streptomyces sp. NPDC002209]|uniref:LuxR C-terminal-related transcriptional regulator n=1 Tax=Streptomyces sp. NPDC002209 TaxID=3364638 RepID=UPI0036C12D75
MTKTASDQNALRAATLRVAVVECHPLLRAGIRSALDGTEGIDIVAETGEAGRVVPLVRSTAPDVVLMDLDLPGSASLEVCRSLVRDAGLTGVLGMTRHGDDVGLLRSALVAGVRGYVSKSAGTQEVVSAVHMVGDGFMVAGDDAARLVAGLLRSPDRAAGQDPLPMLTRREREILDLVGRGYDNRRIARALTLADKTVRNHVSAVFGKIGVNCRAQAVVYAREAGMGMRG